ncbi:RETSAT [Bugula neritina]|uniref:RETSAT n=1 Tax=Bugula neritina TaxID=10212 RepID=A0A7J7J6M5_BUGNE|nr:RETSAT [Bugula neritina]
MFTKGKPGKNPFLGDCRKPSQSFVHDKAERDKILKQGFTRKKVPENLDAIVIGSGISGLTTASLLAKAGKKVLVLEQHDQAGGCCHTFVEKGFEFDSGIHYIGEMQHRTLGRTLFEQISDGQVQWAPLEQNFDTVALGEPGKAKLYPLLSGKKEFRQSLVDNFPDEVKAIDKYFDMLKKARGLFLYFVMLKTLPTRLVDWIIKLRLLNIFTSYELKAVLAYCYGDYGTSPDQSSVLMHAVLINHFSYASSYPVGGASEIAFHIIPVIERSLGRVLVRANVTDIIMEKGRAVGVRVSKGEGPVEIRAKIVISAAGVPNTLKMLPAAAAEKSVLSELMGDGSVKSGVGAFSLFVGLRGTTEELGLKAQNLWAFTDADLCGDFKKYLTRRPDVDNPSNIPLIFVSFPSSKDPTQRGRRDILVNQFALLSLWETTNGLKNGKMRGFVAAALVQHRGDDYEALKLSFAQQMWSQVCKFYPQLEGKDEYMELGSPVTNNYYIRSTKGEIYGLDHNYLRFRQDIAAKLRPQVGVPGLYLTGQDVLLCGFSGGMYSGLLTASAVLHRDLFKDCMKLHNVIKKKEKMKEGVVNGVHKSKSE